MPTRKSGVDWKARCMETRKTLEAERKAITAMLSKIHTWASMADFEIDNDNFGIVRDFVNHITNEVLRSGYIDIKRRCENGCQI